MDETAFHFVFADRFDPSAIARAEQVGRVTALDESDPGALRCALRDADALLVRTSTAVTRELIAGAPKLRVVGRGGVGLDHLDLVAAAERGITVVHTPVAATESVADLTLALFLSLVRDLPASDRAARGERYRAFRSAQRVCELHELTVGIVGMGRIGRAVARRCRGGFGCRVIYHDIIDVGWLDVPAEAVTLDTLVHTADVVSLHVPLTPRTRRMIDAEALSRFKHDALLINTSRGAVVDGVALAHALGERRLAGAALDVQEEEPLPEGHPLLSAPNCILTPHVGARSVLALARMNDVVDDVVRVLRGQRPAFPYEPPYEPPSPDGERAIRRVDR